MGKTPKDPNERKTDGRRNNRTPVHSQIQPGEIRNPNGRAGKASLNPPNEMDRILWDQSSKIVSRDEDGLVNGRQRLVQEEFAEAFINGDAATRVRLIAKLHEAGDRIERDLEARLTWALDRQRELREEFHRARKMRRSPPDILPHPEHVQLFGTRTSINGPECHASRESWEWLKALIKVAACLHDLARKESQRNPSAEVLQDLEAYAAHRRKLMRLVPKGWNWREEIWTRDSKADLAAQTIRSIKEIGYVYSQAED